MSMTVRQRTSLVFGLLAVGAAVAARAVRRARAIDLNGRSVLITGGSRGLGLAIARELGRRGARITITARDADELERARDDLSERGISAEVLTCDVSNPGAVRALIEGVVERHGRLDVLINNAGTIMVGPFEHMTVADFESSLDVHFWGPLHAIRAALPAMRRQGGGRIVNVSSIGGRIGVPHLVPYCAGKFALAGLSDSLRGELAKDRVYVTTVIPGLMRTGSPFNAWFKGRRREEFTWFTVSDSLPLFSVHAARAAWMIVDALQHGDAELVIGWPAKAAVVANAIAPGLVAGAAAGAARVLPQPTGRKGDSARSGWQSFSAWAPSRLTALTDQAAAANNEVPSLSAK
jgi:NAD(P)-dependent dehydrogenase (short-subunit alcohol dehydrogenase family)